MSGKDGWTSVKYSIFFSISERDLCSNSASSTTREIRNCLAATESISFMFLCAPPCPLWLRLGSLPENRRPHAHATRPLFDRDFEIMRHPHRKHIHPNST